MESPAGSSGGSAEGASEGRQPLTGPHLPPAAQAAKTKFTKKPRARRATKFPFQRTDSSPLSGAQAHPSPHRRTSASHRRISSPQGIYPRRTGASPRRTGAPPPLFATMAHRLAAQAHLPPQGIYPRHTGAPSPAAKPASFSPDLAGLLTLWQDAFAYWA